MDARSVSFCVHLAELPDWRKNAGAGDRQLAIDRPVWPPLSWRSHPDEEVLSEAAAVSWVARQNGDALLFRVGKAFSRQMKRK